MFTTILKFRKRVFKGYRVKNACIDAKIHLSVLKCYEQFGLNYIAKSKHEIAANGFDTDKYDDIEKPIDPYDSLLGDDFETKKKHKNKHKKKNS